MRRSRRWLRRYFNPRAPCGARRKEAGEWQDQSVFQPTRPLRGATVPAAGPEGEAIFQPTRPLRGATENPSISYTALTISTHAPLAGRDAYNAKHRIYVTYFNPRAPCGARRLVLSRDLSVQRFQPTRPLRGATGAIPTPRDDAPNFNPRAPCGARHCATSCVSGEAFNEGYTEYQNGEIFHPTRPLRGATILGITSHSI